MPQIRILYVEDNFILMQAVRETLEAEGWEVDTCTDGALALEKIAGGEPYDVLLFDNELPGASGLELTRSARRHPHRRRTPIIMLSASAVEMGARLAGVNEFLRKPSDIYFITGTIRRLLGARDKKEGG